MGIFPARIIALICLVSVFSWNQLPLLAASLAAESCPPACCGEEEPDEAPRECPPRCVCYAAAQALSLPALNGMVPPPVADLGELSDSHAVSPHDGPPGRIDHPPQLA